MTPQQHRFLSSRRFEYAICVAHLHVTTCIDFAFVGAFALAGLSVMVLFFPFLFFACSLAPFSLLLLGPLNIIPHLQDFIHDTSMGYIGTRGMSSMRFFFLSLHPAAVLCLAIDMVRC
jgi:hypothetical protein